MKIELKDIINVLSLYNINSTITGYHFFMNGYNEKTLEVKVIAKAEFSDRNALVVKFVRENNHSNNIIEEQSRFSEHLRNYGVLTPKRYKIGDKYCNIYHIDGLTLDVTVEDYIGEEIKVINNELAYKIGQLMGANHCIAEKDNLHINADTIFNVVGYNEVSGYNDFIKLGNNNLIEKSIFDEICTIYEKKLNKIKTVWADLPKYATQGDYSINNLTYIGNELGIFDYNIAGDATLIGDMILEGLLTANEMDLADGLIESDRLELFKSFVKGYIIKRPLSEQEKHIFNDIYTISQALWSSKIIYSDNLLEKLIENNEIEKVTELLQKIYKDITDDNCIL
jgi:Ser/Thr protein kinase RdoA (MazF antagonist)